MTPTRLRFAGPPFLVVALVLVAPPVSAQAAEDADGADDRPATRLPSAEPEPAPNPEVDGAAGEDAALEEDFDPSRDHFEATLGIIGGLVNYSGANFAYEKGDGPVQLQAPFAGAPYDGTPAVGMRIELRYVASHVRTTLGVDLPFPSFTQADTVSTPTVNGVPANVSVQKMSHTTFHFGFGGELSFGPVTPFLDVLGGFHFLETRLAVDDRFVTYGTTMFGIGARGGARIALKKSFFIHASATGGILGPSKILGELGLGFAI